MPPNPRRVQAVFLEAADCHDPVDRTAILDRECSVDVELRRRVEALLRAHDEFNSVLNDPVVVTANPARRNPLLSDHLWRLRRRS
jgi:eukaryotic-like serine/threonine-protein kinase